MCFISFCGCGIYYCFDDFLVFFELGHFNTDVFFCLVAFIILSRVLFFFLFLIWMFFPGMVIMTVAMTHLWYADHVVSLGIFSVSQKSSLGQNVVNLFFYSFW